MRQQLIAIELHDILNRVARMKRDGCRLVQLLCTRIEEGYELTYSFDKNYFLYNLRVIVPNGKTIMSVTSQYWYAFVWENEIHDLFGLQVEFISPDVDYGGKFFKLAEKTPWAELAKSAPTAMKVNLRSGLGVDASVKQVGTENSQKKEEPKKVEGGAVNG